MEEQHQTAPLKVCIYVRVSTNEQAENNWSIEGQLKEVREYCERKGYRVVRIYKDQGYSGGDLERPLLQKLIEHAVMKKFDAVIIWRYDRLSRDNMDFTALLHFFKTHDIQIESVNEPTPNDGSPYNEFIVGILGLVASLERRVLKMRMRMGKRVRAQNGFYRGSIPPFGYDYNKETGHLEINEKEAAVVITIFQKYLEKKNIYAVNYYLRKTKAHNRNSEKGSIWHSCSVRRILMNRVYLGEYQFEDIVTKHENIRLISDEDFENAQLILEERQNIGIAGRYSKKDLDRYLDELSFDIDIDNPLVQEYIQKKASMPLCPKCHDNLRVHMNGVDPLKNGGVHQRYFCTKCNKNFVPEAPKYKEKRPNCPNCAGDNIQARGWRKAKGQRIRKWFCKDCQKHFTAQKPGDSELECSHTQYNTSYPLTA